MGKITIKDIGHIKELRQRMGLEAGDKSMDAQILEMSPFQRVKMLAGWNLGDAYWADIFKGWLESQGLYITVNENDPGVITR